MWKEVGKLDRKIESVKNDESDKGNDSGDELGLSEHRSGSKMQATLPVIRTPTRNLSSNNVHSPNVDSARRKESHESTTPRESIKTSDG